MANAESPASSPRVSPPPPDNRRSRPAWLRRGLLALCVYVVCTALYALFAGERLAQHTLNNHFAIQAEVWSHRRWYLTEEDLVGRHRRKEVDMGNDWAVVRKPDPQTGRMVVRYYNSFPVFPAVLMYPFVVAVGSAVRFPDALFVVLLAGVGPTLLFLALERLREQGRTYRKAWENVALAGMFAFGTVYFFSAVQGTVWFAAHVVAVALSGAYLLACFHAESWVACLLAGLIVGAGVHTRAPFPLCSGLFLFESLRVSLRAEAPGAQRGWKDLIGRLDFGKLLLRLALFSVPVLVALWLNLVINEQRFGNKFEFGHALLNVGWMDRVRRFGLFSYHYLSRNLTCAFTLLPIINPANAPAHVGRIQVSGNGLALWFTTPMYLWLLWPRRVTCLSYALWATALPIALLDFLYQNSGWLQFGYRFSNDYAPYLFVLLAIGLGRGAFSLRGRRLGLKLWGAVAFAVVVNGLGALTFQRAAFDKYYFFHTYQASVYDGSMGTQSSTYPPD